MSATYICECEHPKSQHKRERDGCRAVDCGCAKFEADLKASAAAQGVERARVATAVAAVDEHGGESTSARLRRVEQERDQLADEVKTLKHSESLDAVTLAAVDRAAGRDIAKPDEPLITRVADLKRGRTEATQRALELAAELASARTELEKLRGAQADLLAGGPAPSGRVISVQQRYLCETCGGRYGKPFTDHPCGRLTPVVVTIARQLA